MYFLTKIKAIFTLTLKHYRINILTKIKTIFTLTLKRYRVYLLPKSKTAFSYSSASWLITPKRSRQVNIFGDHLRKTNKILILLLLFLFLNSFYRAYQRSACQRLLYSILVEWHGIASQSFCDAVQRFAHHLGLQKAQEGDGGGKLGVDSLDNCSSCLIYNLLFQLAKKLLFQIN